MYINEESLYYICSKPESAMRTGSGRNLQETSFIMELLSNLTEKNLDKLGVLEDSLGYSFSDPGLLQLALIHRSFAFENDGRRDNDNERLEFLGDAVLDLAVGYALFVHYGEMREGELTRLRSMLVNESHLAEMAEKISLGKYILLGKGEEASSGSRKPSILSSAYEAVVGAIFHDGGYEAAKLFTEKHFFPILEGQRAKMHLADAKSRLQELTQERYNEAPVYVLEKEEGPDHQKTFTVAVQFRGRVLAHGKAGNKKEAEQKSAAEALVKFDEFDIPSNS